ncbi:MAG: hypothetical protein EOP84_25055 [Verrucomicrobiaceae bacterium]|nr:MAG: hypothetical protein EOP84_25055 [Verrucomicrobiaceae bacterium]
MDKATELAIRAIVRGLYHTDAIDAAQVRGVCAALKDAAGAAQERYEPEDAKAILTLCKGIKLDTAVS